MLVLFYLVLIVAGWMRLSRSSFEHPVLYLLVTGILSCAGVQDACTMYFSRGWLPAEFLAVWAGFCCFGGTLNQRIPGLLFCLILPFFVCRHSLGIADVWMMTGMALAIPSFFMMKAVSLSVILAIVYGLRTPEKPIPFISALSAGCLIILAAG